MPGIEDESRRVALYPNDLFLCFVQGDKYGSRPISELDVNAWEVGAILQPLLA